MTHICLLFGLWVVISCITMTLVLIRELIHDVGVLKLYIWIGACVLVLGGVYYWL